MISDNTPVSIDGLIVGDTGTVSYQETKFANHKSEDCPDELLSDIDEEDSNSAASSRNVKKNGKKAPQRYVSAKVSNITPTGAGLKT